MRYLSGLCVVLSLLFVASDAMGQVSGNIIKLGDNIDTTAPGTQVDVWGFEITNRSGFEIFTLNDISFSGEFLQDFGSSTGVGTSLPAPGGIVFADTFFADDRIAPTAFGELVDNSTTLSAQSIATIGMSWISDNTSEVVAVFSVDANGAAPVFDRGQAVVDGQFVDITAVPEPSSLVVIGMGGLCVLVRRRRSGNLHSETSS